jgi:hypothetical protein
MKSDIFEKDLLEEINNIPRVVTDDVVWRVLTSLKFWANAKGACGDKIDDLIRNIELADEVDSYLERIFALLEVPDVEDAELRIKELKGGNK